MITFIHAVILFLFFFFFFFGLCEMWAEIRGSFKGFLEIKKEEEEEKAFSFLFFFFFNFENLITLVTEAILL